MERIEDILNVRNGHVLSEEQIDKILDKLVPLIAKPEDHGFFRGVLKLKAQNSLSCDFAVFVKKLLDTVSSKVA